jgi:hypothetical protein
MVFKNFFDEVLVKNGPGRGRLGATGLQEFGQTTANAMSAGTSLTRDRYYSPLDAIGVRDISRVASRGQLAIDEAAASFQADGAR